MARANGHFLPGHLWHITHPSGDEFQLFQTFNRFAPFKPLGRETDKIPLFSERATAAVTCAGFEAKKRFGLSVLNHMVTSNHIHLLVKDTGPNVIAQSMQLIAGRTAQEYNQRKREAGSVLGGSLPCHGYEADEHLHHCLVYIDLNMVRAGRGHPPRKVVAQRLS